MAKSYFRNLLTAVGVALDGGARQREAERQSELARLTIREGRAIPQHIAIIMDGNGRWATQRHLPRAVGHPAGVEALRRVVQLANDYGVPMLTVYAFSTENWGRPQEEVDALMRLMWETIRTDVDRLNREGVRLRHIGRLEGLPPTLQDRVRYAVELTQHNTRLTVNVAFNYGGRDEILEAARRMLRDGLRPEELDEKTFSSYLYTGGMRDPDLIIRTAGEMRLSNFLIWQAAYAEYYSTPLYWPDFGKADLQRAVREFCDRDRRFGSLTSVRGGFRDSD